MASRASGQLEDADLVSQQRHHGLRNRTPAPPAPPFAPTTDRASWSAKRPVPVASAGPSAAARASAATSRLARGARGLAKRSGPSEVGEAAASRRPSGVRRAPGGFELRGGLSCTRVATDSQRSATRGASPQHDIGQPPLVALTTLSVLGMP